MCVIQCLSHFEFDENSSFNQQVCGEHANQHPIVPDLDAMLLFYC